MSCAFSQDVINDTISFHGHSCLGLAIGIRVVELAIRELGKPDEVDMVAISETDMCGVDAIQYLTGCTYGKGNFLHRDYGKMAFSFYDRETGKGIRAVLNSDSGTPLFATYRALMNKEAEGKATEEEIESMEGMCTELQAQVMDVGLHDLFDVTPLDSGLPRPARVLASLTCAQCGESTMESRTRRLGGETLCIPCFTKMDQKC